MLPLLLVLLGCNDLSSLSRSLRQAADAAYAKATTPPMPCDAKVSTDPPKACLSGELYCGSVIEATTEGGEDLWEDSFYSTQTCHPAGSGYSGPERIYRLKVPAYTQVTVDLQSDCVDLDLAAIGWNYTGSCPTENHRIPVCDGSAKNGSDRLVIQEFKDRDYLIAVDGKYGKTGTFRLSIGCEPLANAPSGRGATE